MAHYYHDLLCDASSEQASEIHIKNTPERAVILMKCDGRLLVYCEIHRKDAKDLCEHIHRSAVENEDMEFCTRATYQEKLKTVVSGHEVDVDYRMVPTGENAFTVVLVLPPMDVSVHDGKLGHHHEFMAVPSQGQQRAEFETISETNMTHYYLELLRDAVREMATEIHIQNTPKQTAILMKQDGRMMEYCHLSASDGFAISRHIHQSTVETKDIDFDTRRAYQAKRKTLVAGKEMEVDYRMTPVGKDAFTLAMTLPSRELTLQ